MIEERKIRKILEVKSIQNQSRQGISGLLIEKKNEEEIEIEKKKPSEFRRKYLKSDRIVVKLY